MAGMAQRIHGHFLAGEAGELAGVSGTTIGQWARWGYIRSSQSDGDPRVYSVEDVAEAAIVADLLSRGVRHADIRRTIHRLGDDYGSWPLSEAHLATTADEARPRVVLRENGRAWALGARGWQLLAVVPPLEDVRLRLRHAQR
jgi:DNA-binding transcriptional MerR regulator